MDPFSAFLLGLSIGLLILWWVGDRLVIAAYREGVRDADTLHHLMRLKRLRDAGANWQAEG